MASTLYARPLVPATPPTPAALSVMQFNVLANSLTASGGFILSPPESLQWNVRKQGIQHEITRHLLYASGNHHY
jgi:mRNA deadenylase 3'-5' endonuclease subunit Ccr4